MTDAERSDMRVEAIVDLVNRTREIDRSDMGFVVRVQDMLNVSQDEAEKVVAVLGKEKMGRLMWIVTCVCGFDTFEFWMKYGYLNGYKRRIMREVAAEYQAWFDDCARRDSLLAEREELVGAREAAVDRREKELEVVVWRRLGQEVSRLRGQVRALQAGLEDEIAKNRKAKAIVRLVKMGA